MTSDLLDRLERERSLPLGDWSALIAGYTPALAADAAERAVRLRKAIYGNAVYVRGLIEISSYCKNDC